MDDITERHADFLDWYFAEVDARSDDDDDPDWLAVACALQLHGQCRNGGLALYCAGDLDGLGHELAVLRSLGLKGFADALAATMASGDEEAFDTWFEAHADELFLAARQRAIDSGLYRE